MSQQDQEQAIDNNLATQATVNARTLRAPLGEVLNELPSAAVRANKVQAFDSSGQPIFVLPGTGTASEVLINFAGAGAGKNVDLINYSPELLYTSGLGKELGLVINLDTWPNVFPNSSADSGPGIRTAMATGRPLIFNSLYTVGADPAAPLVAVPAAPGAVIYPTYALNVTSGSRWIFTTKGSIKQANGSQAWMRTVVMAGKTNIKIWGELNVDANIENLGSVTNEHQHGIMIYNSKKVFVQSVFSRGARGDNLLIGGDDEITFSDEIVIGNVRCEKAGRKNLTFSMANVQMGDVWLDNSSGGAGAYAGGVPDTTDKHCIDVEPDVTSTKLFTISMGNIKTYGLGNDITAGTTPDNAKNYVINCNSWVHQQSGSSSFVQAFQCNAITFNCSGTFEIRDCAGIDNSVEIAYAANFTAGSIKITGASATAGGALAYWHGSLADTNTPRITSKSITIENSAGVGVDGRSAHVNAGVFAVRCPNGYGIVASESVGTVANTGSWTINHLDIKDTGIPTTGGAIRTGNFGLSGISFECNKVTHIDTRGTKVGFTFQPATNNSRNIRVSNIISPNSIPLFDWSTSADKYYRVSGQTSTAVAGASPGVFVCQGTPEGMVLAAIGSTAMRIDGGAGTSFYVKQAGVSNTGWVAK
jgi:hypothetical protein